MARTRSQTRNSRRHVRSLPQVPSSNPVPAAPPVPVILQTTATDHHTGETPPPTAQESQRYRVWLREQQNIRAIPILTIDEWVDRERQKKKRSKVLQALGMVIVGIGKMLCWFLIKLSPPVNATEINEQEIGVFDAPSFNSQPN